MVCDRIYACVLVPLNEETMIGTNAQHEILAVVIIQFQISWSMVCDWIYGCVLVPLNEEIMIGTQARHEILAVVMI